MPPTPPGPVRPHDRRFSVADGLVLIGASAIGLALVRGWRYPRWCGLMIGFFPGSMQSPGRRTLHAIQVAVSWAIPFAMSLTVACLVLRLRSPRPSLRRVARHPGTVACLAALAAMAFRMGEEVFLWVLGYLTRPQSIVHLPSPPFIRFDNPGLHRPAGEWLRNALLEMFPNLVSASVVVAIAVAWCVLRVSGRWRPAAGWIDRFGRWLGWFWIGLGIALAALTEVSKVIG